MIADIASGHTALADVLFLIAVVLAVLAAVLSLRPVATLYATVLAWLALAAVALGWLVL